MNPVNLKTISTRELLNARRQIRFESEWGGSAIKTDGGFKKRAFVASRLVTGGDSVGVSATIDELKAELATRQHLPSKAEGKLLRRLMSQTGQSAEWLRAHPRYGMTLFDNQHPNRRVITKKQAAVLAPQYNMVYGASFGLTHKVK